MATREDDAAIVTLTATELTPLTMDWSAEGMHKEFMEFKTFDKVWLETKSMSYHEQYILMMQ